MVYDRLVSDALMDLLPATCSRHYVGKTSGYHSLPQPEINQLLADTAKQNKRVVRLKGGDPFIFGRGAEELEFLLQRGIDCRGGAGHHRRSRLQRLCWHPADPSRLAHSCQFITGHLQTNGELHLQWDALARAARPVFYMGLASLGESRAT